MSINILRVVEENIGGTHTHLATLDRFLLDTGRIGSIHTVSLIEHNTGERPEDPRLVHHRIHDRNANGDSANSTASTIEAYRTIDSLANSVQFDIIHIHSPYSLLANFASVAAIRHGIPVVLTYHGGKGVNGHSEALNRVISAIPKLVAKRKLAVSHQTQRQLGSGTEIIGVPIDVSRFSIEGEDGYFSGLVKGNGEVVFYPARINPSKGQLDLVQASKRLRDMGLYVPFYVIIAGQVDDREYLRKVTQEIARNGLDNKVFVISHIPFSQMGRAYRGAYLNAFPTRHEGLAKITIEAGLCGVPTVAYDVDGVKEVIDHQRTGLLVDPRNTAQLADDIAILLINKNKRDLLGANARKEFSAKYDARSVAQRNLAAYDSILTRR